MEQHLSNIFANTPRWLLGACIVATILSIWVNVSPSGWQKALFPYRTADEVRAQDGPSEAEKLGEAIGDLHSPDPLEMIQKGMPGSYQSPAEASPAEPVVIPMRDTELDLMASHQASPGIDIWGSAYDDELVAFMDKDSGGLLKSSWADSGALIPYLNRIRDHTREEVISKNRIVDVMGASVAVASLAWAAVLLLGILGLRQIQRSAAHDEVPPAEPTSDTHEPRD